MHTYIHTLVHVHPSIHPSIHWYKPQECPSRVLHENRKKKILSFFPSQPFSDIGSAKNGVPQSICFSNTNSTHTHLCLFAVSRQGTHPHCQEFWFSTRKTHKRFLLKGISFTNQKSFLTDGSGYKKDYPVHTLLVLYYSFVPSGALVLSQRRSQQLYLEQLSQKKLLAVLR